MRDPQMHMYALQNFISIVVCISVAVQELGEGRGGGVHSLPLGKGVSQKHTGQAR